jgi:hypothetical protein
MTCNGLTGDKCLTCDSTKNRVSFPTATGTSCICFYGYADLGAPTCVQTTCTDTFGCTNCNTTSYVCTQCDSGLNRVLNTKTYQCDCIAGLYQESPGGTCTGCPVGCATCTSATACTTCYPGATLVIGACNCQNGFYANSIT